MKYLGVDIIKIVEEDPVFVELKNGKMVERKPIRHTYWGFAGSYKYDSVEEVKQVIQNIWDFQKSYNEEHPEEFAKIMNSEEYLTQEEIDEILSR